MSSLEQELEQLLYKQLEMNGIQVYNDHHKLNFIKGKLDASRKLLGYMD